jgi:hypothetical protein
MNVPGFTTESLKLVSSLLYAETPNPLEGQCNQKQKKKQQQKPQTPEQEAAAKQRAQTQRGKDNVDPSRRSEAAKKAAETRRRCKGLSGSNAPAPATTQPAQPTQPTQPQQPRQ